MFCRSLFVLLYFFFWPLCCLSFFDIRILITPLVSSNSSYSPADKTTGSFKENQYEDRWSLSKSDKYASYYIETKFDVSAIFLAYIINILFTVIYTGFVYEFDVLIFASY
jgi:hypothetical protein